MEPSPELDIGRYLRLLYKERSLFIVTMITVASIVIAGGYLMPKVYEAQSIIFIEKGLINDLMKDVAVTESFEERTKALSVVMKSRNMILKVLSDIDIPIGGKSDKEIEQLVKKFQDKTDIKIEMNKANRKDMDLFIVTYSGSDPKLASDYVNALVRRYVEENLTMKREAGYGANRFLSEQIGIFKEKIDGVEAEIAKLKKEKGGVTDEALLLLQKRLNDLLVQYTGNHPEVIKVKTEIDLLKKQLRTKRAESPGSSGAGAGMPKTGATYQQFGGEAPTGERASVTGTGGDGSLKNPVVPGETPARDLPAGNKTLQDMERTRDAYKKIYEELLAALGKSEVSTQVEVQDKAGAFRILDPAIVPTIPVSPNRVKMILLGIFGGIAAGFGAVILADTLDRSIKSIEQLKAFGLPVLAVIPAIRTEKDLAARKKKDTRLYTFAGVYFACILGIFVMEFMGLPYVDDFIHGTLAEIKNSIKNIL